MKFLHEETGKQRKLSPPWHGPYRVISNDNLDMTVVKIYFPQETQIQVHQTRVTPCPNDFSAGYYWHGRTQHSPGWPPRSLHGLVDPFTENESNESSTSSE